VKREEEPLLLLSSEDNLPGVQIETLLLTGMGILIPLLDSLGSEEAEREDF